MTGFGSQSFALVDSELIVNVVGRTMGGRGEREIGSRALLAGRTGGMLGGSANEQGKDTAFGEKKSQEEMGAQPVS